MPVYLMQLRVDAFASSGMLGDPLRADDQEHREAEDRARTLRVALARRFGLKLTGAWMELASDAARGESNPVHAASRELALIELQFQVARRADALARRFAGTAPGGDRRLWLRAECEIFDRGGRGPVAEQM